MSVGEEEREGEGVGVLLGGWSAPVRLVKASLFNTCYSLPLNSR